MVGCRCGRLSSSQRSADPSCRYAGSRGEPASRLRDYRAWPVVQRKAHVRGTHKLDAHLLVLFTALAGAFAMVPAWSQNPLVSLLLKSPAILLIALIVASYFGADRSSAQFWPEP